MLPRDLQFELRPRRSLPSLRSAVVVACLLMLGGLLTWLVPRQRELDHLRGELEQASLQLAVDGQPPPASGPMPAWQANAEQDGRLFELRLEPRLLEIERCTGSKAIVSRIVHDGQSGATTIELNIADTGELAAMLECFNTSDSKSHRWRLSNVELTPANPNESSARQRAILKFE